MTGVSEAHFVTRTMQALELLAFQPATAPQVAAALHVHPGTARRLLNQLVTDGWLSRFGEHRRRYAPTMRIVAMAAQLADRDPLTRAARPVVTQLHAETGVAAHLCIPSYRSVLCLVHRAGDVDARPQLRELVPAHAAAAGKAMLAYRDAWRGSLGAQALPALTGNTLIRAADLERDAADTRARGYAVDDEELELGMRGIAAPVRGRDGTIVAGLALSGPNDALPVAATGPMAALLIRRARDIERALADAESR